MSDFLKNHRLTNVAEIKPDQLKIGDHNAYKQLFTAWYEPLCNYACSILRDMDEAEDIVQKMFCKLWDQRNKIAIRTSVKSYLYRAVHNDCLNRIRQVKTRTEHNQHYAYVAAQVIENTSEKLINNELEQEIAKAIAMLPPKCKQVFEMSRMQQMNYAEIAQELEISTNTVENHIAKALKLLRVGLKDFLLLVILIINVK